jgi:hypothetical protein
MNHFNTVKHEFHDADNYKGFLLVEAHHRSEVKDEAVGCVRFAYCCAELHIDLSTLEPNITTFSCACS